LANWISKGDLTDNKISEAYLEYIHLDCPTNAVFWLKLHCIIYTLVMGGTCIGQFDMLLKSMLD
jgi:hypothetical protein